MIEPEVLAEEVIKMLFPEGIEFDRNGRNFDVAQFTDRYGSQCSIQASSLATEAAIWFGVDKLRIQHFKAGEGWNKVPFPPKPNTMEEHWVDNARMHLTQDMVRALLPSLIRFGLTGNLR